MSIPIIIVLIVVALIVIYCIVAYNTLTKLKNRVKTNWAQIDVVLKRWADLIPNLVETVKGYASHEKETLENAKIKKLLTQNIQEIQDTMRR